jgi:hypothetical protein
MPINKTAIKDREELLFLLSEAAEFEHTVMCSYLYASMTLKRTVDEAVNADDLVIIDSWRTQMRIVALEEMLHLTLVNNMLAALGSAPHFSRPNFPVPPGDFLLTLGLTYRRLMNPRCSILLILKDHLSWMFLMGSLLGISITIVVKFSKICIPLRQPTIQLRAICITLLLLASIFWLNNWVRRCSLQGMVLLKLVVLNSPCPGFSL